LHSRDDGIPSLDSRQIGRFFEFVPGGVKGLSYSIKVRLIPQVLSHDCEDGVDVVDGVYGEDGFR